MIFLVLLIVHFNKSICESKNVSRENQAHVPAILDELKMSEFDKITCGVRARYVPWQVQVGVHELDKKVTWKTGLYGH